jgi:hypothetical protein
MFRIGVLDTDDRLGFDDRRRGLAKKTQPHVREFRVRSRHPSLLFPEVASGFSPRSYPICYLDRRRVPASCRLL